MGSTGPIVGCWCGRQRTGSVAAGCTSTPSRKAARAAARSNKHPRKLPTVGRAEPRGNKETGAGDQARQHKHQLEATHPLKALCPVFQPPAAAHWTGDRQK